MFNRPILFKENLKQSGTTAKRHKAALVRRNESHPFKQLCRFYCSTTGARWDDLFWAVYDGRWLPIRCTPDGTTPHTTARLRHFAFLLLASQRRTDLPIEKVASTLGLDPVEAATGLRDAEIRLARSERFAVAFRRFLRAFDRDEREQANTIQQSRGMTYEEIAEQEGWSWQRVQQCEQQALAKLKANPEALKMLARHW